MAKDEKKDGEKKEKEDEVICAVYKLNLHCRQCARQIQKPLKRCKGDSFDHYFLMFSSLNSLVNESLTLRFHVCNDLKIIN